MRRLLNQMKLHGSLATRDYSNPIVGFVSAYDPDNYCCKITIYPEDEVSGSSAVISGWIPIGTIWCGNGWGLFCPPSINDMVEVDFQEGDFEAGHVDWRFFNDENRPVRAESGIFYIIHKSGSKLRFENDGKIHLESGAEINIGDSDNTLLKLVTETFMDLFNTHTHKVPGVQSGVATVESLLPDQEMTSLHLTTIVKAN